MAENTSVGSIQLDVEINQNSLNTEMNKLASAINGSFKNMFEGFARQTSNFIRKSISGMFSGFRKVGQASEESSNKASKSISKMNAEYEKTQQKINEIRNELAKLFAEQDAIIRNYQGMPPLTGMTKDESLEYYLKSDPKFNELSAQIDNLESRLEPLIAKNKQLAEEINKVGNESENTSNQMNNMGNSAKKAAKSISGLTLFKKIFNKEANRASQTTSNFGKTLNRVSRIIVRNLIVYGLIIKGIRGIISYTWSALKANEQFSRSLNTIKTNLIVAFQPIYNFVLPAINALIKAIATITTYIASAISALFGKTYKQSFNAAKGLENAKKAMTGYGSAAKKAGKEVEGVLMSFDEINQLDLQSDADDSSGEGAGEFEMTIPDLSTIDMSGIEKFKEVMSKIFEPFKSAWEKEGQNTINSIKYALGQIKESVKAIGNSWLEVWTNGTGQKTVENILVIIQNLFNIVGNLADAFRNAWEQNNIGISIVQNIADIFNIILETIRNITGATAEWAKGLDFTPLLESVNKLLEALKPFTENIGQGLAWLWENVLLPLASWTIEDVLPRFLELLANTLGILNETIEALKPLATWLWEEFLKPLAQWTGEAILQALDWLNDELTTLSTWIQENQSTIQNLAIIVGSFAAAWGLVNAAITIWNGIATIATGVTSAFGAAIGFLTSPIGIATTAIGSLIAIGVLLYKNWDEIDPFLKETWESIKNKAEEIWNGIKEFFSNTWDNIKTKTSETWDNIKSFLIDKIWNPIKEEVGNIWDNIKKSILDKWDEIRQGISNMKSKLVSAIKEPFNTAKEWIGNIIKDAQNWGKNLIGNIVDGIKSMIGKVRDAAKSVAETIFNFLGHSSPTKEGPGKTSDKWMPNLMQMLAEGLTQNIPKVKAAVDEVAKQLTGIISQPILHQPIMEYNTTTIADSAGLSDSVAQAVYRAMMDAIRISQATSTQHSEDRELVLKLDNTVLARMQLPALTREAQRQGFDLIIRPQGV